MLDDVEVVDPQPITTRTSLIAFSARLPMSIPQANRAVAISSPVSLRQRQRRYWQRAANRPTCTHDA